MQLNRHDQLERRDGASRVAGGKAFGARWPAVLLAILSLLALTSSMALAESGEDSPFGVEPTVVRTNGLDAVTIGFRVPARHHLYADELSFEIDGVAAKADLPAGVTLSDRHSGTVRKAFEADFAVRLTVPVAAGATERVLVVNLRGCTDDECFFPETRRWRLDPAAGVARRVEPPAEAAAAAADGGATGMGGGTALGASGSPAGGSRLGADLGRDFTVAGRLSGYVAPDRFLGFLEGNQGGGATGGSGGAEGFAGMGLLATLALILAGGLALNLTPCVLPMIPITLAVLGVGTGGGGRRRGFALGGAYGLGMALAYGGLGVIVVLTGSRFGALQSSAWFNAAVAVVFVVLGLAMFDRIPVDLSRFQRRRDGGDGPRSGLGALAGAGAMGFVSALLAGACVAPVVISVLLLATTQYQAGHVAGLLLPFLLGVGMALPWPFAAAGLSFLPRPGAWMTRVKHGFGVLIFVFAAWYGWLAWGLAGPASARARGGGADGAGHGTPDAMAELERALADSRRTGRPVVIDFWASWCKNCAAMERTTLRDAAVRERLGAVHVVRFQAERLDDPMVKPVLDRFSVMGLPTFVLLRPGGEHAALTGGGDALERRNP